MKSIESMILKQLVNDGKVSEHEIASIENSIMTPEKEDIIYLFHSVLCKKDHDSAECPWYMEEQMEDIWSRPCHAGWVNLVMDKLRQFNMTPEGAKLVIDNLGSYINADSGVKELISFLLSPKLPKL